MSSQIPGDNNYYLNTFNEYVKKFGIDRDYTKEEITSIFSNSEKDEYGNVLNDVFMDKLLAEYGKSHEDIKPENYDDFYNYFMLLSFNSPDGNQSSISKTDLEQAFDITIDDVFIQTPNEGITQGYTDEVYQPETLDDETEVVDDGAPETLDETPDVFDAHDTEEPENNTADPVDAEESTTPSTNTTPENGALSDEDKIKASFLKESKVKQDDDGNYYVDVEKYTGDHSRNGCVWDIVYNSYDLTDKHVSWDTLKNAIYEANGGEKTLHPGDKIILPPLEDIINGTVKSPQEAKTDDPANNSNPSEVNTMEPSGNLELTGDVSDNKSAQAYLNDYLYVFDTTKPDNVEHIIEELIPDEEVSISDKMKILNIIYNDKEIDNKSVIKSYFEKSDKFFADTLNEIANNRDKYTYGDLNAFVSRYSVYNPGGSFTLEDTPNIINAWVNVLNTAQNQDEINSITNRRFRNPEENGMLTLTEAIYEYTDNPSELAEKVLVKSSEQFADKNSPSDYGIDENRISELTNNYGNDFNGLLQAISDLRNGKKLSNTELLYLIQNYGDISSFIDEIKLLPENVQKAVFVVLQEAYKNEGNAYELLDNVSRSSDRNNNTASDISYGYANTIRDYLQNYNNL